MQENRMANDAHWPADGLGEGYVEEGVRDELALIIDAASHAELFDAAINDDGCIEAMGSMLAYLARSCDVGKMGMAVPSQSVPVYLCAQLQNSVRRMTERVYEEKAISNYKHRKSL